MLYFDCVTMPFINVYTFLNNVMIYGIESDEAFFRGIPLNLLNRTHSPFNYIFSTSPPTPL